MANNPNPVFAGERHRFLLNPYEEFAFTRRPKCSSNTSVRKFPLVIPIDPRQLLLLNKTCKFCPRCDLIIARQSEMESLMVESWESRDSSVIGNPYLAPGTLDRKDWRLSSTGRINQLETLSRIFVFKEVLNFEITGGWQGVGDSAE